MFLQIETPATPLALALAAIGILGGVIAALYMYNKSLQKELVNNAKQFGDKLQDTYREQIKDNKEIVINNTKAIDSHSSIVAESIDVTKELKSTIAASSAEQTRVLQEMRIWLKENYSKSQR